MWLIWLLMPEINLSLTPHSFSNRWHEELSEIFRSPKFRERGSERGEPGKCFGCDAGIFKHELRVTFREWSRILARLNSQSVKSIPCHCLVPVCLKGRFDLQGNGEKKKKKGWGKLRRIFGILLSRALELSILCLESHPNPWDLAWERQPSTESLSGGDLWHLEVISSFFSDPSALKCGAGWDEHKAKEINLKKQKAFGTFSSANHPILYLLRLLLLARTCLKIKIKLKLGAFHCERSA